VPFDWVGVDLVGIEPGGWFYLCDRARCDGRFHRHFTHGAFKAVPVCGRYGSRWRNPAIRVRCRVRSQKGRGTSANNALYVPGRAARTRLAVRHQPVDRVDQGSGMRIGLALRSRQDEARPVRPEPGGLIRDIVAVEPGCSGVEVLT